MRMTDPARVTPAVVAGLLGLTLLLGCKPGGPAASGTGSGSHSVSTRPKVFALLVGDTTARTSVAGFSLDVERNLAAVRRTLATGIGSERLAIVELTGDQARPERVEAAVRELGVTPSDTLVCYVTGMGECEPRESDGFRFSLSGSGKPEPLPRPRLREWLAATKPHLLVLLSDTAGGVVGSAPGPLAGGPSAGVPEVPADIPATAPESPEPSAVRPGFQALFLAASGVIDLTGADDGAGGWGPPGETGFFTRALCTALTGAKDNPSAAWPDLYPQTRAATEAGYRAWRAAELRRIRSKPQPPPKPDQDQFRGMVTHPEQVTQAYYLSGTRLKIFTREAAGGVEVTELPLDSPGRKAGLKVGDVITRLRDTPVASAEAWAGAVGPVVGAAGRQVLALRVRGADGQEREVSVELP
jgi:hypothetical protein